MHRETFEDGGIIACNEEIAELNFLFDMLVSGRAVLVAASWP
jgi:hypothetical protein